VFFKPGFEPSSGLPRVQDRPGDNNRKSKFAQHLLDEGHAISNMEDIMKIPTSPKKGDC